jgi:hypothetical protein
VRIEPQPEIRPSMSREPMRCRSPFVTLAGLALVLIATAKADDLIGKSPVLTIEDRTTEPLLGADRPWERFCLSYITALRIEGRWHLWYTAHDEKSRSDADCSFCYARSDDGVKWEKPSLGLIEYGGDKENNIVAAGQNVGSVFLDAADRPERRFKAAAIRPINGEWWVFGGTSPDGLRWSWLEEPLLAKNSDTANACFRDGDLFRLYTRVWTRPPFGGHRVIGYADSTRFENFSEPTIILAPDGRDPEDLHFYSPAASKLKDGLYLMLPSGFTSTDGASRIYAAASRDGKNFNRVGAGPLLDLGRGFDSRGIYVGAGAIPAEEPGTYWFYYLGTAVAHDDNRPGRVKRDGGIGRFRLRVTE